MLTTKEEILAWLLKNGVNVNNCIINEDLTVDVKSNLKVRNKGLTELPIQFGIVTGHVDFGCNELISLKGFPYEVVGDLGISRNKLTSLEYCPKKVGGSFDCRYNKLETLKGGPKIVGGDLYCHDNLLKTFNHFPEMKKGKKIVCFDNKFSVILDNQEEIYEYIQVSKFQEKLEAEIPEKPSIKKVKL